MLTNFKKLRDIFTRRERFQLFGLLLTTIVMAFFQAVGIASVLPFIGLIMEPNMIFENSWLLFFYESFNFQSIRAFIVFVGIVMFFLIVISNIVSAVVTWLKIKFSLLLNHRLSKRLLKKYLNMPYAFFLNRNSADLSNKVLGEVGALTGGYVTPLLNLVTRAFVSIFILAMLLFVDVWVSVSAIILFGGTYTYIYRRISHSLAYRGARQAEAAQALFKAVSEAFGGIKEVKVTNRQNYFLDSYSVHSLNFAQLNSWVQVIGQLPRYFLEAIAFGGIILFVLFLLQTQQDARQVIPLASLFAFAGYRLMPALQEIFQSATSIKYSQAILDRVHVDMTDNGQQGYQDKTAKTDLSNVAPLRFNQQISLKDVSFKYAAGAQSVLTGINIDIKYNTKVAFVGPTGTGKTTLVDIILGLLVPSEGTLIIDGMPVNETNLKSWQHNLGYVPQHIYLSDDTIKHNIAFGLPYHEIDLNAVEQAARIANIHDFITEELPNGYDTLVGERGIRLSGGQRQRIGIARALCSDPAVLVFDEATSALDGTTEDAVLDALENATRLKTLIIIAHRLTTVKNCDVVYMIDRGRITASGTYAELLDANHEFRKMAKIKA